MHIHMTKRRFETLLLFSSFKIRSSRTLEEECPEEDHSQHFLMITIIVSRVITMTVFLLQYRSH